MIPDLTELPTAAPWQAALALAPALMMFLGALLLPRGRAVEGAATRGWQIGRRITTLALGLTLAGAAACLALGSAQAFGWRSDGVGSTMSVLVAFIGWVIVRYSRPYLDGLPGQAGYLRWLLLTLGAVLLVVASNHLLVLALAWTASSLSIHHLLTFFVDRRPAIVAAHKKFVLARLADAALLLACVLLARDFGTLRLDALAVQAASAAVLPAGTQVAVVLVVVAVLLKCAQLPFHGWLIQVMEAPTPVSALLHAGIVNLGGFVLLRLATLVADVPAASALLVVAGTATAVTAALVMTTRVSIKVSLAWSTCAQMGFMLMQCGLGLWEMAMLHLVAHSLYKAHAFLAAGGVLRQRLVRGLAPVEAVPGMASQLLAAALAVGLTALAGLALGLGAGTPPAVWVAGGIVALALTPMVQPHAGADAAGMLRGVLAAFALAAVYFALHLALHARVAPADAVPHAPWWPVPVVAFALLFALQCVLGARPQGALAGRLYPWFYGGLFLDERFSHALFRFWPPKAPSPFHPAA